MFSEFTSLVKSNFKHTSIFYFCSILLFFNITSNCKAQLTAEWASVPIGIGNNYGYTISVDDFGNSYIAGTFTNDNLDFGNGVILSDSEMDENDIFIAKYNNSGEAQWAKTFNTNTITNFNDLIIKATPEGEVYLAGSYTNTEIDFGNEAIIQNDSDSEDIFLVKYNTDGEAQWAKSIGNSDIDKPKSLAIDSYGNIYIAGYYSSSYIFWGIIKGSLGPFYNKDVYLPIYTYNKGENDMFLAKYNRFGNLKWAKSFGDTGNDVASSLAFDVNGNLYLAGKSDGDFLIPGMETGDTYLIQFDDKGQINWLKSFNFGRSVSPDTKTNILYVAAKGNIYLAGSYNNSFINFGNGVSLPESDISQTQTCIVKFNNIGEAQWANKIDCIVEGESTINENKVPSIALDNFENIYITGYFASKGLNFGDGIVVEQANYHDNYSDIFFAQYNSNGIPLWANAYGGGDHDSGYGVDVDNTNHIYITGIYKGHNLNFGNGVEAFTNPNIDDEEEEDIYVTKFSSLYSLEGNRYPLGIGYIIENENGVNPITPIDKSETNGLYLKGLAMYDIGDRIRYRFEIPEGGNYQLNVRLRSGDNNGATSYWPNGYQFQVNGSTETFEGDETTVEHFPTHWGNSWFGVMHSSAINLEEGINEIIIQANGAWTILDYLEVLPATSSLRKSATLSDEEKIILFPNPASAATEYFNIEAEKDIFRITVFKMNGEQSINNEVIIKNNSAKIKMPTAGYTMPKFKP